MVIIYPLLPVTARIIHTIHVRSAEIQQENDNNLPNIFSRDRNIWPLSQVQNFQFLLPFWWHYLRPMLSIFTIDTNLRQKLQKEYEFELDHGSSSETEQFSTETEVSNIEKLKHETEATENDFVMTGNEPADELGQTSSFTEGEKINQERENAMNVNPFGTFLTEPDSVFSETEGLSGGIVSEEDGASVETLAHFENSFTDEIENGESSKWDALEHGQFGMTGNIVGAFSNSLMGIMPSKKEAIEFMENTRQTNDEQDVNSFRLSKQSESGSIELQDFYPNFETANFENSIESGTASSDGANHFEEDFGKQSGMFQNNGFHIGEFQSGSQDGQTDESSFFPEALTTIPADPDNVDNNAQSFTVSAFSPRNIFSQNFGLQNEQDSSS